MEKATDQDFEEKIAKGVVLVDFYADWCGPCKMLAPLLEALEKELGTKAKFYKLDCDANIQIPTKYEVTGLPTLILFKDGQPVKTLIGLQKPETIKSLIEEVS